MIRQLERCGTAALLLVQGCATAPSRLPAVPSELTARAEIPGMPGVRYVAGGDMTGRLEAAREGLRTEQESFAKRGLEGPLPRWFSWRFRAAATADSAR